MLLCTEVHLFSYGLPTNWIDKGVFIASISTAPQLIIKNILPDYITTHTAIALLIQKLEEIEK